MPYLKSIMGFLGIDEFKAILVEGVDAITDCADEFRGIAADKALEIASVY